MGDAATATLPNFTAQDATTYKAAIDGGFAIADRLAWAFAPHQQATPDMTVRLAAGAVFDGATLSEVAVQSSATIAAPTTDPRIDRVVIDRATGVMSVVTGAEAPSPTPPAIGAGTAPVAQVALSVSQTAIVNADITDERDLRRLGLATDGSTLYALATGSTNAYAVTLAPAPAALVTGMKVRFKTNGANTASATLDVNGLGAKTIKKNGAAGLETLEAGDLANASLYEVAYDGTDFELTSPISMGPLQEGKHAIWVPADAMRPNPTGGAGDLETYDNAVGSEVSYHFMPFDATAVESATFQAEMPKSWDAGAITFSVVWTTGAIDTGNAVFELAAVARANGDGLDNIVYGTTGGAAMVTDAAPGAAHEVQLSGASGNVDPRGSATATMVFCNLRRLPTDAADTMAVEDARVLGLLLHYTVDKRNDE